MTLIVAGPVSVSTNTQANLVIVVNPPQLSVQPSSYDDFGLLATGQSSNQQFLVVDPGDETLIGTRGKCQGVVRLPSPAAARSR